MSFNINFQTPEHFPQPMASGSPKVLSNGSNGAVTSSVMQNGKNSMASVQTESKKENSKKGCSGFDPMSMILIGVMVAVFWLFIIRPQKKQQEKHANLLNSLIKGDKIVTSGGILGTIVSINDRYATVEVADKTRIRLLRSHISGKQSLGNVETASKDKAVSKKSNSKKSNKDKTK